MKILIVDDSKAVQAFLKSTLSSNELHQVFNGKEATDTVLGNHQNFDLILLDWEMPIQNGPTTLEMLRKAGVQTPVLMMTTKNLPEDITQMLTLGANEYMLKPFTADILFEKIEIASGMEAQRAA